MNVFCSWCNEPLKWSGIEFPVSHSICRECCREHFPSAVVNLAIRAMGLHEAPTLRRLADFTANEIWR